jgi:hypothetical protein
MSIGGKAALTTGFAAAAIIAGKDLVHEGPVLVESGVFKGAVIGSAVTNAPNSTWRAAHSEFSEILTSKTPELGRAAMPDDVGLAARLGSSTFKYDVEESVTETFARQSRPLLDSPRIRLPSYTWNKADQARRYSRFFDVAEPKIVDELSTLSPPITAQDAENIIKTQLATAIQQAKNGNDSEIAFEVLTGKLTIDSSKMVFGSKVSGGQVNIYKVTSVVAGSVAACTGEVVESFKPCVRKALAKATDEIAREFEVKDAEGAKE